MKTYLIQSIQTPQEFWSNNLGWVSMESADRFTGSLLDSPEEGHRALLKTESGSELNLPLGGKWILDFVNPYQCDNCEHTDEYRALPKAQDILERFEPGETYTDVECPQCGALCFPVDVAESQPATLAVAVPPTQVFTETEMTELLEFARLALFDSAFFARMAEECDLSDEYLIALREKLQEAMDSDIQIFDSPTIVPGMRVRWNDPDDGLCSHEGIVRSCTAPIADGIIVLQLEDDWSCECLREEIEILNAPKQK